MKNDIIVFISVLFVAGAFTFMYVYGVDYLTKEQSYNNIESDYDNLTSIERSMIDDLISGIESDNISVESVNPYKDFEHVYEIVMIYDDKIKTFYLDERDYDNTSNTIMNDPYVNGLAFCPENGEYINESTDVCYGKNITSDVCNDIYGMVLSSCDSRQTAIAFVGDKLCCRNFEDNIIISSVEACETACEVIGFFKGSCGRPTGDSFVLSKCVDGVCYCEMK